MVSYFAGGAMGSMVGAHAWSAYGWPGVCVTGMGFAALAGWSGADKPLSTARSAAS
jgi:hypothetical protein